MSKVTHYTEIDNYEVKGDKIEVHHSHPQDDENSIIAVDRETFELFLLSSGRLNGTRSVQDELQSYTSTPEEYWQESDIRFVHADLKAYLLSIEARTIAQELKNTPTLFMTGSVNFNL